MLEYWVKNDFPHHSIRRFGMGQRNQDGFTLFEIIVTLLLAGIMMTGAAFIYRDFMDYWEQESSSLEMQRQGMYALTVMEKRIKGGNQFTIGNYGGGTDNLITVTVSVMDTATNTVAAKDIKYYQDGTGVKEREDQEIMIVPESLAEGIQVANLKFTDESVAGSSVRIDLRLRDEFGKAFDFTGSMKLRNESVQ